jgi:ribonuclease III
METTREAVNKVLRAFNPLLTVNDVAIYARVLDIGSSEWQRMEFLGDAVINLAAAQLGYERYPEFQEGKLSQFRTSLVKGDTLTAMCTLCGLADVMPRVCGGDTKFLEDLFECFVGAMYLDSGYEHTKVWFWNVADAYAGTAHDSKHSCRKTLLRLVRNRGQQYEAKFSRDGTSGFFCTVYIDGAVYGIAHGVRRNMAEETACESAYHYITCPH